MMKGFQFKKLLTRSPAPAAELPQTLHRKRVYILPNRYGWLFVVVLLALLIGAVNYKNNLGFMLTFLLGSMFIVSLLYTYRNLSGIQVHSVMAQPVFAGDPAVFKFRIDAGSSSRPVIVFSFSDGAESRANLTAGSSNWIDVSAIAETRGFFRPGELRISTQYPLGLFRAWSRLRIGAHCLVFPKPLPGPFMPQQDPSAASNDESRAGGPGVEDFQGLRSYKPGDSLKHVSWKAYSRGQGLFTKEFVGQTGASVMLDWHALGIQDPEHKLSRLCHMVLKAHTQNLTYGLNMPGQTIDPDRGKAHRQKCLRRLALHALPRRTP